MDDEQYKRRQFSAPAIYLAILSPSPTHRAANYGRCRSLLPPTVFLSKIYAGLLLSTRKVKQVTEELGGPGFLGVCNERDQEAAGRVAEGVLRTQAQAQFRNLTLNARVISGCRRTESLRARRWLIAIRVDWEGQRRCSRSSW